MLYENALHICITCCSEGLEKFSLLHIILFIIFTFNENLKAQRSWTVMLQKTIILIILFKVITFFFFCACG